VAVADSKKNEFTYPYPRPSLTVDVAVITLEDRPRVLLIQRKAEPFKGYWALPGGFVDENERLDNAARRELKEETGLEPTGLRQLHTFGDPGRDPRGWTVSVAYLARVQPDESHAVAGDDAAAVSWFRFGVLPPLAFDHAEILRAVHANLADNAA
jgi:8-oxo-dGTP diphosphatase